MANAKYKPPFGFSGPGKATSDDDGNDESENPYREGSARYATWEKEHGKKPKQIGGYGAEGAEDEEDEEEEPEEREPAFDRRASKSSRQPIPQFPQFIPNLPDDAQITITFGQLKELLDGEGV
jgi:hypothetical protein